jgi:hypothetical protein
MMLEREKLVSLTRVKNLKMYLLTFKEFINENLATAIRPQNHDFNANDRFEPELAKERDKDTRKKSNYKKLRKLRVKKLDLVKPKTKIEDKENG